MHHRFFYQFCAQMDVTNVFRTWIGNQAMTHNGKVPSLRRTARVRKYGLDKALQTQKSSKSAQDVGESSELKANLPDTNEVHSYLLSTHLMFCVAL